jgi:hypothetical protein
MSTILKYIQNNPHPSFAAIALFALSVAAIIWPEEKTKLDQISRLAMSYGILTANYTTGAQQVEKQQKAQLVTDIIEQKKIGQDPAPKG